MKTDTFTEIEMCKFVRKVIENVIRFTMILRRIYQFLSKNEPFDLYKVNTRICGE